LLQLEIYKEEKEAVIMAKVSLSKITPIKKVDDIIINIGDE
jgi:hypothetical protein